jgi:SNF2 family DNA or RNA helicase
MIEFKCDPLQIESRRLMDLYNGLNDDINSLVDFGDQVARPKRLQFGGHRNGLDDFLRDVMVRNRKPQVITQPLPVALSPLAKLQYLLLRDLVHEEGDGLKSMVSQKLCELVSSPEAFRRSSTGMKPIRQERYHAIQSLCKDNPLYEAKKDRLLDFVMNAKLPAEKRVIVIFCRYIPTLDHLSKAFKKLKQTNHVEHVYRMDGKTKVDSRGCTLRCIEARNRDRITIKPIIFLVSQVANEGLDFDRFSNTVVHFDGHYNPAIMDQRNGRVYRGKNTTGSIRSCQVILSDTYDQRIKFIELEKRKMKDFYLGDGELEPIFEAILESKQDIKRTILKRLTKFKLDLQPRVEWLLPSSQSELP